MRATAATSLLVASVFLAGCPSVDPTDPSHFTDVVIRNDTGANVVIVQCDTSCRSLHDRSPIRSGGATIVNVSHEGFTVGYVVERPSGLRLGCLYMRFNGPPRHMPVVNVSSLTRCR